MATTVIEARAEREPRSIGVGEAGIYIGFLVVATILLVALAFGAHANPYFGIDLVAAQAVQSVHAQWFDTLMNIIDWPGFPPEVYVELILLILVMLLAHRRWQAICVAFSSVAIGAGGLLIKMLVDRPRPSPALIHVANPALDGGKYSFTAGHVESYVAIIGFLWFLVYVSQNRSAIRSVALAIMTVFLVLIGVSRVYSGEHWLSDVIGGYLFGAIVLSMTIELFQWGRERFFVERTKT